MRYGVISFCGILGLSVSAHSQNCAGDPGILLTASDPSPSIGLPFTLTAQTNAGDFVVLLVGFSGASIGTPYGPLCVALPAAIVTFPQFAPSVDLPATIPFDANFVGLTPHFQFFSKSPSSGVVHRSNSLSVMIDSGATIPFPIETIPTKIEPREPALVDLDGDAVLDLVIPYLSPSPAEIAHGVGDGSFGTFTAFSDPIEHNAAAARDVDGDSDLDLLLTTAFDVQVWKNDGAEQFTLWGTFVAGPFSARLSTGDFDLDGDLDVATANALDSRASVLVADGSGSFAAPVTYFVGALPRGIAATDLNADGDLDLAVTQSGVVPGVSILFGSSSSSFVPTTSIPTGAGAGLVVAADLDADGRSDLVVSNTDVDTVTVLRNQTSFFATTVLNTGDQPYGLAVVDLDVDGILDIAVGNGASSSIGLFRGLGPGSYASMLSNSTSGPPGFLAAGDLDQDGRPDLVATFYNASAIALHLDRDGAGFGLQGVPDLSSPSGVRAAVLGDFDADSDTDVFGIDTTNSRLLRYFGNGAGTFTTAISIPVPASPVDVVAADLDNDADLDVLTSAQNLTTMGVQLGSGAGNFTSSTTSGLREGILALGDLDGDGTTDFAAAGRPAAGANHQLQGFRGVGNGSFTPWPSVPTVTFPTDVVAGDIDLDGDLDCVVTSSGTTQLQIYRGNGLGSFASASLVPIGKTALAVALGDLDSDGDLDGMVAITVDPKVTPCFGNGLGSFAVGSPITIHAPASSVRLADFDGDQRLDIAAVSTAKTTVSISFAAPGGGYPIRREFKGTPGSGQLLIGLVNQDALPDIVTVSTSPTNSLSISLHR